jgi:hypothetical protein
MSSSASGPSGAPICAPGSFRLFGSDVEADQGVEAPDSLER